jgi:hypothetical protein
MERLTGFEPVTPTLARWCSDLLSYNRMEPSPGLEPGSYLLPLGYEDVEPIPGVEPGRPPYEGGAASRAHRHGFRGWGRTSGGKGQSLAGIADVPPGNEYAGRDLNPQTARFELASFAG